MAELDKKLMEYGDSDAYAFHMPGHKRVGIGVLDPYKIDITEIDGFDNMNDPQEILLELMQRLGALYGRKLAYILINGSTAGNLSAVFAATKQKDHIIIARDSHKSVYNAAFLRQLEVSYLYPHMQNRPYAGPVTPEMVEQALQRDPLAKAVVITSPSYEGVISDVDAIGRICHKRGVALIVDAAHGAHFGMAEGLPALPKEADVLIMSLHKTLPSFTSTGTVLRKEDGLVDKESLEEYLHMFQTSSPSYILMGGIAACVRYLEEEGQRAFAEYIERMERFYRHCDGLEHLKILRDSMQDISKIVIYVAPGTYYRGRELTGEGLMEILRERYHLELEMAHFQYALAMTSLMDTTEGLERLEKALFALDEGMESREDTADYTDLITSIMRPKEKVMEIYEAREQQGEVVALEQGVGRICKDTISLYPPGIPVIVPGERVDGSTVAYLKRAMEIGLTVTGLRGDGKSLKVC